MICRRTFDRGRYGFGLQRIRKKKGTKSRSKGLIPQNRGMGDRGKIGATNKSVGIAGLLGPNMPSAEGSPDPYNQQRMSRQEVRRYSNQDCPVNLLHGAAAEEAMEPVTYRDFAAPSSNVLRYSSRAGEWLEELPVKEVEAI